MKISIRFTVKSRFVDTFKTLTGIYNYLLCKSPIKFLKISWDESYEMMITDLAIIDVEIISGIQDVTELSNSLKEYCENELNIRVYDLLSVQVDIDEGEYELLKQERALEEL